MAENPSEIRISRHHLERASETGLIASDQADRLWRFLGEHAVVAARPRFDVVHLLWYGGALIVIAAMGLFTTLAWELFGGATLTGIALVYAAGFGAAGHYLWHRRGLVVPGGLLVAVAVTMAPLATYGVQDALGWWSHDDPGAYRDFFRWIKGSWLFMELATIAAGAVALRFYRFPFLLAPVAVALWFMSMDLVPWVFGTETFTWDQRKVVSLWFGLAMLPMAWVVDVRARGDFAFWLHLFGLLAFWGGLSLISSDSEIGKAIYCLINVALLCLAVFLQRRAYAVFGTLGVTIYLGHLSYMFADSLLFPFALSAIGVAIIAAGLLYYRRSADIEAWVERSLPPAALALRPTHARALSGGLVE